MCPLRPRVRPRVVLADDHAIVLEGLRQLLEPEYEVAATVGDGRALLKAAADLHPDVVVADISMPLLNGIDAIRELRAALPALPAICLTMHADRTYLSEAIEAGAAGFVVKHAAAEELREALRAVLRGGTYVSPLVGGRGAARIRIAVTSRVGRAGGELTARQRQVLQLVAEGHTVKRIARMLGVSPKTVEFHKYRILAQLGLNSTAQLARYALQHHLIGD